MKKVGEKLVERGCDVTSISKSGKAPSGGAWTQQVKWVANDLTRGSRQELEAAVGQPDVAVSCVGTVGFDGRGLELGNGVANVRAAEALKGVQRYVLVSVASEVAAAKGWLPGYFEFYFKGKAMAEAAATEAAGEGNAYVVKPSFIYGGDSFELFPPRVASGYGAAIEEILSNAIITKIADVLPGLLKVALRPPSSVDAERRGIGGYVEASNNTKAFPDGDPRGGLREDFAVTRADDTSVRSHPQLFNCLLYTSPSPRDRTRSRMPSSA